MKELKSVFIRINDSKTIEIKESKTRRFLAEQKEGFHKLLKKCGFIKE